jgi:uncharacterized protein (DUF488 family)
VKGRPDSQPAITIYTVGHSHRTVEELAALVQGWSVKVVADVRRFPASRRWPWWTRESMERDLAAMGLDYVWLGDLLGGLREGGYEAYMETAGFRQGIGKLIDLGRQRITAMLCAEKDYRQCHRRFIAGALAGEGVKVFHIVEPGLAEPHPWF